MWLMWINGLGPDLFVQTSNMTKISIATRIGIK